MKKFSDDVELFIDTLESGDVELVEGVAVSLVRIKWLPCIRQLEAENASLKRENDRLRDEILRENTKFGQVERDDLIG